MERQIPPEPEPTGTCIRVMTFNIHSGVGVDGTYDLERVARTIEAADPDIVGLQEVDQCWDRRSLWDDQVAYLARRLNMTGIGVPIYTVAAEGGQEGARRFGCAILTRLPVLGSVNHALTRISTLAPELGPQPLPGFGEVVVDCRGYELRFFVTHLYWRSQELRCQEVQEMEQIIGREVGPFVVVGDYNAKPEHDEMALAREYANDAWLACGTGNGFTFPAHAPDRRIDYIFVSSDLRVRSVEVLPSEASDHLPVVCDIDFG